MTTRAQATQRIVAAVRAAGVHALAGGSRSPQVSQLRLPTGAVVVVRSSIDAGDGRVVTRVRAPNTRPGRAGRVVAVPEPVYAALRVVADDVGGEVRACPTSGDPTVRWPACSSG